MRSRYSAFVTGDTEYLLRTWHPGTRPPELELDPKVRWRRLEITATEAGGPLDTAGVVSFEAHFRQDGTVRVQRERSEFVRRDGRWLYVSGD